MEANSVASGQLLSIETGFGLYCRSCTLFVAVVALVVVSLVWMSGELRDSVNSAVAVVLGSAICTVCTMWVERTHLTGFAERVWLLEDSLMIHERSHRRQIALRDVVDASDHSIRARLSVTVDYVRVRYVSQTGLTLFVDFLPTRELRKEEFNRSLACAMIMRAAEYAKRTPAP